jgi:hypothetical protein
MMEGQLTTRRLLSDLSEILQVVTVDIIFVLHKMLYNWWVPFIASPAKPEPPVRQPRCHHSHGSLRVQKIFSLGAQSAKPGQNRI